MLTRRRVLRDRAALVVHGMHPTWLLYAVPSVKPGEILPDKIDHVDMKKTSNAGNFPLIHPNLPALTPAAVAGALRTCAGIKTKIKSVLA